MGPILPPSKDLQMSLLVFFLQLLELPDSSLADLVVKEKDVEDLQLDQLQAQAHLVEDTTLPFQCQRQVTEPRHKGGEPTCFRPKNSPRV